MLHIRHVWLADSDQVLWAGIEDKKLTKYPPNWALLKNSLNVALLAFEISEENKSEGYTCWAVYWRCDYQQKYLQTSTTKWLINFIWLSFSGFLHGTYGVEEITY